MDAKLIFPVAIVCVFANLGGCAGTAESPGNIRLQSNPENSWKKGAQSLESGSEPAPRNVEDIKRGNTPPGKDRAGGDPGSGTIVDPAGVLTK